MPNFVALDEEDALRLCSLQSQVHACLAMSRATLQALSTLSPLVGRAALEALSDEAWATTSEETSQILAETRAELARPGAARALERALIRAAQATPIPRKTSAG
jgi:hypothetical protein